MVGHIPQPKAVRDADALAGVRDPSPPPCPPIRCGGQGLPALPPCRYLHIETTELQGFQAALAMDARHDVERDRAEERATGSTPELRKAVAAQLRGWGEYDIISTQT